MLKRAQFILGGVMLLFLVGVYIALGIAIDASVSDLIPFWPSLVSLVVTYVAMFAGFWYMPEQRRTPAVVAIAAVSAIAAIALAVILRDATMHWISQYVPVGAAAIVIIICVAVFLPVKNNTSMFP